MTHSPTPRYLSIQTLTSLFSVRESFLKLGLRIPVGGFVSCVGSCGGKESCLKLEICLVGSCGLQTSLGTADVCFMDMFGQVGEDVR